MSPTIQSHPYYNTCIIKLDIQPIVGSCQHFLMYDIYVFIYVFKHIFLLNFHCKKTKNNIDNTVINKNNNKCNSTVVSIATIIYQK